MVAFSSGGSLDLRGRSRDEWSPGMQKSSLQNRMIQDWCLVPRKRKSRVLPQPSLSFFPVLWRRSGSLSMFVTALIRPRKMAKRWAEHPWWPGTANSSLSHRSRSYSTSTQCACSMMERERLMNVIPATILICISQEDNRSSWNIKIKVVLFKDVLQVHLQKSYLILNTLPQLQVVFSSSEIFAFTVSNHVLKLQAHFLLLSQNISYGTFWKKNFRASRIAAGW